MIDLRWYQTDAIDAVNAYWRGNGGSPIVCLPTGSGKSYVLAGFIERALRDWPDTRILVVSHVREILTQDIAATLALWAAAPVGVYSAGLKRRDINAQVLFASIQSIYRKGYDLQRVDIVIIDEAHLVSPNGETMYRSFLRDLTKINPYIKCFGLTATPFRLNQGYLHKGPDALFTDIAYDAPLLRLIEEGYLCNLTTKSTDTKLDVTAVKTRGGEFIADQLAAAVDKFDTTKAVVREIVARGANRRSWLVFCVGVAHAYHVRDEIRSHGIICETVTGGTPFDERNASVEGFRSGAIRCLTNANVLTTGVDVPGIDLIAFLRPTKSTGLYLQMAGRGFRVAPTKKDTLVLDFARLIAMHGPVDAVDPKTAGGDGDGDAPVKTCPQCQSIIHAACLTCPDCGYEFPPREPPVLARTADTAPIISDSRPQWVDVDHVTYARHQKEGKPDSMRVTYHAGLMIYREWLCFEHSGYAREKACQWWIRRAPGMPVPSSVVAALEIAPNVLSRPSQIAVRRNGKYYDIVGAKF